MSARRRPRLPRLAKDDTPEIVEIMPYAAGLVDKGRLSILTQLYEAMQSKTLAIQACWHEFFEGNCDQQVQVPCAHGVKNTYLFTRC